MKTTETEQNYQTPMNRAVLKEIQDRSMEILKDFDTFCQKHDIQYSIAFGTALGAVRHNGFIPWDDDIDVQIHIRELRKFEKAWKKYGNKGKYTYQTKRNSPNLPYIFPRLNMNQTTSMEKKGLQIPMHWGLPLDIFPYYDIPANQFLHAILFKFSSKANRLCKYSYRHYESSPLKKALNYRLALLLYGMICFISKVSKPSGNVAFLPDCNQETVSKDYFEPVERRQFENLRLPCPVNYDPYLRWIYNEYMTLPPENERLPHSTYIVDLHNDYTKYVKWKKKIK